MLTTSRLYSFLDHLNGFNIHFLEGQKLIHDLALTHPLKGSGFAYFRDTLLGIMPIIFYLKPGESLGIYIDSEDPYFRLKIETNNAGHTRTLLLPMEFNLFPMKITGQVRVTKIFSGNKSPYTSVIELNKTDTKNVINRIFEDSYQTNSEVIVSDISDQSIMITKLPDINVNSTLQESLTRQEFIQKKKNFFHQFFNEAISDIEQIVSSFESNGFSYLGSRQVSFYCPCTESRMIQNLSNLYSGDLNLIFEDKNEIEINCDYCNKIYKLNRSHFQLKN
jgi:molecular chaperone Hsp33